MLAIEIKLLIPYRDDFCLPAFTGTIAGYTDMIILRAEAEITDVELGKHERGGE